VDDSVVKQEIYIIVGITRIVRQKRCSPSVFEDDNVKFDAVQFDSLRVKYRCTRYVGRVLGTVQVVTNTGL
jgi:hypothetical protein